MSKLVLDRYRGQTALLTTRHNKAKALALPLRAALDLTVKTVDLNTDRLGTFTGEVERRGTPLETAIKKARLGMKLTGGKIGLASEGSFGAHPTIPFITGCQEWIVLIDDDLKIQVCESIISAQTNYGHVEARSIDEISDFLSRVKFPSHGLIVRANQPEKSLISKVAQGLFNLPGPAKIHKGIQSRELLALAIQTCKSVSSDGIAFVSTDMRAHVNPTRMRVLRSLGVKLGRRMQSVCQTCQCPGFGVTSLEEFLPCHDCGFPSEIPSLEIHSCLRCNFKRRVPRKNKADTVESINCVRCNP